MTFAEFLGLLQADPAILVPGASRATRRTPMEAISFGGAPTMVYRRFETVPGAKQNIRKLVRGVIAFRRAGKRK